MARAKKSFARTRDRRFGSQMARAQSPNILRKQSTPQRSYAAATTLDDVVVAGERPVAERCDEFARLSNRPSQVTTAPGRRAVRLDLLPRFRRGMEGTVQHINAVFVESCFSAGAKGPQKPAHPRQESCQPLIPPS